MQNRDNLSYGVVALALILYAFFFIFPLLEHTPNATAPYYVGAPGYYLRSPLGGNMRVIPFSGPEFKNPAINPPIRELAPAGSH